MMATDLADYLVRKGTTFREAHAIVGQLVRKAEETGVDLHALPMTTFEAAHPSFGSDVHEALSARASVARREVEGGTGPRAVRAQLEAAVASLTQGGEAPRGNELTLRAD
jgi:argininosuccinate lyase